jgi:hypothetical protein
MDALVIRGGGILDGGGTHTVRGDLAPRDGRIVVSPSATNAVSVGYLGGSRRVARSPRPEGATQPVP